MAFGAAWNKMGKRMGFIFIKETQGKRAFSAFFLFPHFYLLQRGANLLCFLQETVCAPHFFFSWAQEKKKRAAPGVKKKRTFGTTPGITVLLSRAAQCGATLHPVWCKADTALRSQPLPLSAFKIDVPRNRRTQFRLRPGGGSRPRSGPGASAPLRAFSQSENLGAGAIHLPRSNIKFQGSRKSCHFCGKTAAAPFLAAGDGDSKGEGESERLPL